MPWVWNMTKGERSPLETRFSLIYAIVSRHASLKENVSTLQGLVISNRTTLNLE